MEFDLAALPQDVDALHRLIRDLAAQREGKQKALSAAQVEIERLRLIVQKLQRVQFGRRAERLDGDASSTMAGSSSTPTPWNGPSGRSPWAAKNHLLAGSDGGADRRAIVCSPPPSSTTASPTPTSRTSSSA